MCVGRGGRDGQPAGCHMICSPQDMVAHHSLCHSHAISWVQILGLCLRIFQPEESVPNDLTSKEKLCMKSTGILSFAVLEKELDIPQVVAETMLSMLESSQLQCLQVESLML